MGQCAHCGNEYDKSFDVELLGGDRYTFDSFECAIHALAPTCATCGCRIIGHGLEAEERFYCCDHCAEKAGIEGLKDRI